AARSSEMRRPPRALPWLLPRRADDEPLATLRPAALEHPASRLGRVPLAKPVLAIAADLARLVRALHGDRLLRAKSAARKHAYPGKSRKVRDATCNPDGSFAAQTNSSAQATILRRSRYFGDPA